MLLFPKIGAEIMAGLISAEEGGRPLRLAAVRDWMRGSTWDDLWAQGYIAIKSQERDLISIARHDSEFVATHSGRQWFKDLLTTPARAASLDG